MSKPSAETELRSVKRHNKELQEALIEARGEAANYRQRATRAETDAAEWKRRFDLLLSKLEAKVPAVPE